MNLGVKISEYMTAFLRSNVFSSESFEVILAPFLAFLGVAVATFLTSLRTGCCTGLVISGGVTSM